MAYIQYKDHNPKSEAVDLIRTSDQILREYEDQGYTLTLRQLYYQLVSRDIIPNNQRSYKSLGNTISNARDGGMIDWDHIEDRTRQVKSFPHWEDREEFIRSVAPQFRLDLWEGQETRVFVFVEKEALEQVVSRPARRWDCPYFANKGYLSSSAVWNVAHNMMRGHEDRSCRRFVVLHLGDHDPSGIDMSRDIQERLSLYAHGGGGGWAERPIVDVRRIALNMDQVDRYEPPPNPAKITDSRFASYCETYGDESWELDALQPSVLDALIEAEIRKFVDEDSFRQREDQQDDIREAMIDTLS